MVRHWYHLSMLSVESSGVIWLRSIKLALGGSSAIGEAAHIIAEKMAAAGQTAMRMTQGKTPLGMTIAYRRTVRENLHRLLMK
jgi:hypothetical protein